MATYRIRSTAHTRLVGWLEEKFSSPKTYILPWEFNDLKQTGTGKHSGEPSSGSCLRILGAWRGRAGHAADYTLQQMTFDGCNISWKDVPEEVFSSDPEYIAAVREGIRIGEEYNELPPRKEGQVWRSNPYTTKAALDGKRPSSR